ncbi:hypothetical protein RhiirA5_422056 [Rhizophagus irregularis]|uniref:Uncharacterized protein n=1 Tax=Rhizophagus irregularis TaxID=588596 RepID=A0A2N0PCL2_9GLOM|nr:hypothetical protein RhiirA5_422056 [Rhizophagus irregularis]
MSERGVYALCQRGGNDSVKEYWTKGGVTTDWKCLIAACLISEGSTLSRMIERCSTDRAEEIKEPRDVEKCSSLRAV